MSKTEPVAAAIKAVDGIAADVIGALQSGEYMIHVFIEETRGLKNAKANDETVDAIIEIAVFGKKRYTKISKNTGTGATFWGEHFFFEKSFGTSYEVESEKISISVLDHKLLGFNGVIGTVELNVASVYNKDRHCMEYQWAALSGLTKNFQEVLGFVKFSVGVFAAGDPQLPLTEEKAVDAKLGPSKLNVLYPPQITTTAYQIHVYLFRAQNLKKMDTLIGKTDPYLKAIYGGLEVQSEILKITLDPTWNQDLRLPASLPTINNRLILRFYDWDSGPVDDELMGSFHFEIPDILANKYSKPFWANIYGAHSKAKAPYEKMINEVPELGTEWKGRVQLALTMVENPKPVLNMVPIKDATLMKKAEAFQKAAFELRAELHYAMNLRKDDEEFFIKVRWGSYEVICKKKKSKNKLVEFYETITLNAEFPYNVEEGHELPDVFVYLCNSDKELSLDRRPWHYYRQVEAKASIKYFKVDRSVTDSTRDDLGGIIKMRAYINKLGDKTNLSLYGWDRPAIKPQAKVGYKIHLNVYQAKDLLAADKSGLSDPYCTFYFYGVEAKTTVIKQTLNPIWNERLEFSYAFDAVDDAPPIIITMWDEDEGAAPEFIGSAILNIKQINVNPANFPNPYWIDLKYGKNSGAVGKVLLSLCCYSRTELIPRSPYIEPDHQKYFINMKILGLRELKSTGVLPVKRAFVRFDIDSLRTKDDKSQLQEKKYVRTEPLDSGSNPNILTVINLELKLPTEPDYCPSMSCTVFDYIFRGVSQPLIGNFSIPLGQLMTETSTEVHKRIKLLETLYEAVQEAKRKDELRAKQAAEEREQRSIAAQPFNIESSSLTGTVVIETEETKGDMQLTKAQPEEPGDVTLETTEVTGLKPLLGNLAEPTVNQFASIKSEKGLLPGENENVKVDLYRGQSQKSTVYEPIEEISEEAKRSSKFVVYAKYTDKGEEIEKPDTTKYMGLGHNNKDGTLKKHYRLCVDTELEKSEHTDATPFLELPLYRGKKIAENSFLRGIFGKTEEFHNVGSFKAMITVMSEAEKFMYDAKLAHVGHYAQTKGLEFSDDEFLRRKDVTVRLYMIEAEGLTDKDADSNSDPYCILKLGRIQYNEKKFYQNDQPNPKFHKCFEFPASLPGASKLSIQLWDYDALDADDLIGETVIDIEDRWYSSRWRSLRHIPIETRELYHPSSKMSQGKVRLWLEIIPKDMAPKPILWNITPKPSMEFELRVVVWDCKDVPNVDVEDAVDIYITSKLADGQEHRTDTHFRSQNGEGHFNWRMVFPIKLPMQKNRITFQIWDKDLLSANDYISEATFDFDVEADRAFEKEERVKILGLSGTEEKFELPCSNNEMVRGKNIPKKVGGIIISMELVPKEQAKLIPVGQGRKAPNQHPFLPEPEGRFEWSWNVTKLFKQLVGPLARRKIILWISIGCCLVLLVLLLPMIIANLITHFI